MSAQQKISTDVAVVGSGAGGATVARELSKRDINVVLLERGKAHKWIGSSLASLRYIDKGGFLKSEEGLSVIRGITTGGSTLIYIGNAFPPPDWLSEEYGINLDKEVKETMEELKVQPLPDRFLGEGSRRVMEAANDLGYHWERMLKFVDPEKCDPNCIDCTFGCKRGAKWTTREYIKEAEANGARVITSANVREVMVKDGRAAGVKAMSSGGPIEIEADKVVLAAGGLGNPMILQRAGIWEAGQGFFCDPMVMVYGITNDVGMKEPLFQLGITEFMESDGFMVATGGGTKSSYLLQLAMKGIKNIPRVLYFGRTLSLFTKIRDDIDGRVNYDGTFSKPLSYEDRLKLDKGTALCEKILIKAGADPDTIFFSPLLAAHPGATARIGKVVDKNLETSIKNLYVCDVSVMPESLGRPTVLTTIALAKKFARSIH